MEPRGRFEMAGTSGFVVCLAAVWTLRVAGVIVVDDAELSVDVVESVLPERVASGFFVVDVDVAVVTGAAGLLVLFDC